MARSTQRLEPLVSFNIAAEPLAVFRDAGNKRALTGATMHGCRACDWITCHDCFESKSARTGALARKVRAACAWTSRARTLRAARACGPRRDIDVCG